MSESAREPGAAFLPVLVPGRRVTLHLRPDRPVWLRCRKEGRGDPSCHVVWSGHTDGEGRVRLSLPADVPQSYDGRLFRVLWEIQCGEQVLPVRVRADGQPLPDPYAALGLAFNPFRAEAIPERQLDWAGVPECHWLERGYSQAPAPGTRRLVQLLGVKGAGKSSHLARWRAQHPGPGHYYPPQGAGRWRPPPLAPICYWDEACRIPAPLLHWGLSQAARHGHTVCVGTHRDLSAEAGRYGLQVQTIRLTGFSTADALAWAEKRLESARLPGTPEFRLPEAVAQTLCAQCGGSWRELATGLHVWVAEQAEAKR